MIRVWPKDKGKASGSWMDYRY